MSNIKLRCAGGPFDGKELLVPKKPTGEWYAIKIAENKFLIYKSIKSANPNAPLGYAYLKFHDDNGMESWKDYAPLKEVDRLEPTIVNFNGFTTSTNMRF